MARCAGVKRDGGQCTTIVKPPMTYCYQHDPERADERRRASSRAGRTKPSSDIRTVKSDLKKLIQNVLTGAVGKGEAAVAIQGYNALTRTIELERKVRELDEIEARLEELEASVVNDPGKRRAL